jgi:RHS repeat-associated protein
VAKQISRRGAEAQSWEIEKTSTLIWDGFNIIQTLAHSQTHTLTNAFIWGLDLSGTLQGAGGVGELLAEVKDGEPYFAAFDANGNVTEYISTNGLVAAHYEYSPFGEIVVQSGDLADSFTHRFSTKPWCAVTGLSEYEFRKYSPGLGRWLSRDPIGEWGGALLTGFAINSPIDMVDPNGLVSRSCRFAVGSDKLAMGDWEAWSVDRAASLGAVHVDLLYAQADGFFSIIRVGYGGDDSRGLQTDVSKYGKITLTLRDSGSLRWGQGKGTCCKDATCEQIAACIIAAPSPPNKWLTEKSDAWRAAFANCQNDVEHAVLGCCLEGYSAINFNTSPDDFPGEDKVVQKCVDNYWKERKKRVDDAPDLATRFLRRAMFYNDLGELSYQSAIRMACWQETMRGMHD